MKKNSSSDDISRPHLPQEHHHWVSPQYLSHDAIPIINTYAHANFNWIRSPINDWQVSMDRCHNSIWMRTRHRHFLRFLTIPNWTSSGLQRQKKTLLKKFRLNAEKPEVVTVDWPRAVEHKRWTLKGQDSQGRIYFSIIL